VARKNLQQLAMFALLVAIGLTGRWAQPIWCFTPIAAVGLFAGFCLSSAAAAAAVPLCAMALSDLLLPHYNPTPVMFAVYGAFVLPAVLGRLLRRRFSVARLGLFAVLPSMGFWIASNAAVWYFDDAYPRTVEGLLVCYGAALPFLRNMLAGDAFYTAVLFGCHALAHLRQPAPQYCPSNDHGGGPLG
jgi:hypothetical protein